MITQSLDTQVAAEQVMMGLLRGKSFTEKLKQVRSLSQMAIQLSRRAIARANPDKNEAEIERIFISLHYGEDLAGRVAKYREQAGA